MRGFALSLLFMVAARVSTSMPLHSQRQEAGQLAVLRVNVANEQAAREDTVFVRIAEHWRDDPASGAKLAQDAITLARRGEDTTSIALGYCALGINQWALGKNVDAARSYFAAIALARQSGNRDILAKGYNNLGLLYYALGTYPEAQTWFLRSMDLRRQLLDSAGLGRVYTNLGLIARKHGEFDSARSYFTTAIGLHLKSGDTINLARTSHYLGEVAAASGSPKSALVLYNRAEQLFLHQRDRMGYALVLVDIARVHRQLGNPSASLRYARKALLLGRDIHSPFTIRESADILHRIYSAKGDYRAAYETLSEASRFADSLRNESVMHAIASLELPSILERQRSEDRRKLERREGEIRETLRRERLIRNVSFAGLFLAIILVGGLWFGIRQIRRRNVIILEKNAEIETINERLQHINESREKLFSIIGHDLRGPVGATYSIATLLLEREDDLSPTEKSQLIDALIASSGATSDLLDNLLNWSRTQYGQLSFNPTENDLDAFIEDQLSLLRPVAQKKNIPIYIEGEKGIKGIFDSHMISAVVRNLVMNAIKFTGDGGSITINVVRSDGMVELTVRDTGVGMSAERIETLRNRSAHTPLSGTRGERGTGLGLEICREFLDRHNGKLIFESVEGRGSAFTARFPLGSPGVPETSDPLS